MTLWYSLFVSVETYFYNYHNTVLAKELWPVAWDKSIDQFLVISSFKQ